MGSPVHTIRHTSATMKAKPRVTSTCASSLPASRRRIRRSTMPPKRATPRPATSAAGQNPMPSRIRLTAKYAPSMKNEPWVRFGIRISPKISEKPAARRKSRLPKVMLLTASSKVRLIPAPSPRARKTTARASALERRIVARVHGLRQEPLLVVRPELAHVGIRLDRSVDELAVLLVAAADVEGPHDVAQVVEAERAARRVGQRHTAQRLDQRLPVVGLAARLLERRLRHHAVDVDAGGVEAGDVAVVLHHAVDQPLVAGRV